MHLSLFLLLENLTLTDTRSCLSWNLYQNPEGDVMILILKMKELSLGRVDELLEVTQLVSAKPASLHRFAPPSQPGRLRGEHVSPGQERKALLVPGR